MEIVEIMSKIPHRYPFLLVDRIVQDDTGCYGLKNVTCNESFFQGHFPSNPIMPGVMILESMAQTAGLITFTENSGDNDEGLKSVLLLAIDNVKFRKTVTPGDVLKIYCETVWYREYTAKVKVKAFTDNEVAAEAQFIIQNKIGR